MKVAQTVMLLAQRTDSDKSNYADLKKESEGFAVQINKVTSSSGVLKKAPLLTPDEKSYMGSLFNQCISHARKYLSSEK